MSNLSGLIEAERSKPHPRWVNHVPVKRPRSAKQAGIKVKDLGAHYPFGLTKAQETALCVGYQGGAGITDLAADYFNSKLPYAQQRVRKVLAMNGIERRPHPLRRSERSSRPDVLSGKAASKGQKASIRKSALRKASRLSPMLVSAEKTARQNPDRTVASGASVHPFVVTALIDALEIRQAAAIMALKERQPFANVRQILFGADLTLDALASILDENYGG